VEISESAQSNLSYFSFQLNLIKAVGLCLTSGPWLIKRCVCSVRAREFIPWL